MFTPYSNDEKIASHYRHMPHAERGMVIGLFGGSFNPPHAGHALVAELALKRLRLDQLWWMVTPGNPLKSHRELTPLATRLAMSEALVTGNKIKVTAFEHALKTSYTAKTLATIKARNRHVHFVWIMGADNLRSFHHWQKWREIAATFPIAVIDRPGATLSFLSARMAKSFDYARIDETDAARLPFKKAPAWCFLHGPRSVLSSTLLRSTQQF